jgi:hypothetical protein
MIHNIYTLHNHLAAILLWYGPAFQCTLAHISADYHFCPTHGSITTDNWTSCWYNIFHSGWHQESPPEVMPQVPCMYARACVK